MRLRSGVAIASALLAIITVLLPAVSGGVSLKAAAAEHVVPVDVPVDQNQPYTYELPNSEIPKLQQEAALGSGEAAYKLAGHFGSVGNETESIYWLTIAVENGNAAARMTLAHALTNNAENPLSRMRGHYWYRRIIAEGPPAEAQQARDELAAAKAYEDQMHRSVP